MTRMDRGDVATGDLPWSRRARGAVYATIVALPATMALRWFRWPGAAPPAALVALLAGLAVLGFLEAAIAWIGLNRGQLDRNEAWALMGIGMFVLVVVGSDLRNTL